MIHPLSTIKEIEFYLNVAKSRFVLTLDAFYSKFKDLKETTPLETLILARIPDYLGFLKRIGFNLTIGPENSESSARSDGQMVVRSDARQLPSCPASADGY